MGVAFTIPSVFTAVNKVSSVVKTMGSDVVNFAVKAESAIARTDRFVRKLTPGFSDVQKQLLSFVGTAAIVASVMAGINFSVQSVKEYDKAIGSLMAVTGLTPEKFKPFGDEISRVSKLTKESSIDVAKAFETIGSANSSLLDSADAMGAVTQSAITLSQAAGDELQSTAQNLVGVMNQFSLGADQANRSMNVLAAGTKVGAATIPQVAESMKNFGAVANSANISIEQSVALVEVLGTKSIFGAEAGTKLRGSLLKLQAAGVGYKTGQFNINEALEDTRAKLTKLKTAKERDAAITKMFGAENVTTGKILLENVELFKKWTGEVTNTNEATIQAEKNNNTLSKRLDQLSAAWVNMLTGSSKTTKGLDIFKDLIIKLTNNLETVVSVVGIIIGLFLAWKVIVLATSIAVAAYNIGIGIMGALTGVCSVAIGKSTVALGAYRAATVAATAVNWLFNASNPVGWIVILISLAAIMIAKWNEWGAALSLLMGPLGLIIGLIQTFRRNWDLISTAFTNGGILSGIKAIGAALIDVLLMPLQQVMQLISKIPGVGQYAQSAVKGIEEIRNQIGVNTKTTEDGEDRFISTPEERDAAMTKMYQESVKRTKLDVNFNNAPQNTTVNGNAGDDITVKMSSTLPNKQ